MQWHDENHEVSVVSNSLDHVYNMLIESITMSVNKIFQEISTKEEICKKS